MSIKCGHCKEYHESIAELRVCAGVTPINGRRYDPETAIDAASRRNHPAGRGLPNPNVYAGLDTSNIKEGRYAVEMDGVLKFYRVDKPTQGRWNGYTFVKVQASDDLYPVRGASAKAVLAAIAVDPPAAMLRYGKELGSCGHCGRTLTNEVSRITGIGPICRAKMGGWI